MATRSCIYLALVTDDTHAQTIMERHVGSYDNAAMSVELLRDLLARLAGGEIDGSVMLCQDKMDGTAATGTVACTQANATAGDTFTLCGVVFTVKASPSSDPSLGEFAAGASDDAMGENLETAINAHPSLKGLLTAVNAAGTVTWTLTHKGLLGNLAIASTSAATAFTITNPTNGAKGTIQSSLRVFRRGL